MDEHDWLAERFGQNRGPPAGGPERLRRLDLAVLGGTPGAAAG
ncbi:MAG TPA: hypothetical protein VMV92_01575 [Streptosporangiaceae bacterium]|nr:hypothetical protein [Streptosporangiaceae bacterium]